MELSEKANKIFKMKYASKPDETWEEACWRVALHVAKAEKQYGKSEEEVLKVAIKFYQLISNMYFLPGGRILANSGTGIKNLFNCFVLPIEDSRKSIYGALANAAEIFAHGGGVGYNFSHVREEGALINSTRGDASGPLSFMTLFDQTGEVIQQASRRGAQIGLLNDSHPDIKKFIGFKSTTNSRNTRLMEDYDRNLKRINEKLKETKYHKVLRKTLLDDQLTHFNISVGVSNKFMNAALENKEWELISPSTGEVKNSINAKDLLYDIANLAWESGDPGVFFLDRANEDNVVPYVGNIEATNPCVTGDTKILTVYEGAVSFKELADRKEDVLVFAWSPETKLPVVRIMNEPRLTREKAHILEVEFDSGLKVRCTDDHNFYSFRGYKVKAKDLKRGQAIRAFSASIPPDGHLRAHGFVHNKAKHQYVARMVWECFHGKIEGDQILHHIDFDKLNNKLENLELLTNSSHNSLHYPMRKDGGFTRWKNHKVVSVTDAGYEDVYNGTVDDVHTYVIADPSPVHGVMSGIISANCGEVPLLNGESCNLASINLKKFFNDGAIDFDALEYTVRTVVRFLDNVHDISETPIDSINEMNKGLRRLGVGIMGFSDLLAELELAYDSDEARNLANYLSWFISFMAWQESIDLAREKGPFSYYDKDKVNLHIVEKTLNSRYNPYKFNMDEIRETGLRNVSVTSIAPTGTIALIAGVNSGIEPFFSLAYKRNITEGIGNIAKDFVIEINPVLFEKLKGYNYSEDTIENIKNYIVEHGDLKDCPEIPVRMKLAFTTAPQVLWSDHILMQASWQEFVSNAVSKTINCPNETTKEDIYDMYLFMWQSGLKGGTVYRDGSKSFQILEKIGKN